MELTLPENAHCASAPTQRWIISLGDGQTFHEDVQQLQRVNIDECLRFSERKTFPLAFAGNGLFSPVKRVD